MIKITTNKGAIEISLYEAEAPISSENFKQYVIDGFYKGTIFHRVIPNFMVQGGGMTHDMQSKQTRASIKNEAGNGKKNLRGTLAMARTAEIDSASSQFFINLVDNQFLDHGDRDFGYAVFAEVTSGMDVVDAIAASPTQTNNGHQDVPSETITIEDIQIVE
jgi:cyclophilin family peptidyl-prolyl cis-trans isomerase|tara:strand:- start:160 stop:645 length:486 start_codon:yes stop_codon:yes gene_type:complete